MSDSVARPRTRSAVGRQGAWRTLLSHLLIVILPVLGLYVFYVQRQNDNDIDRGFRTLQEAGKRLENDLRALNAWRMPNSSYALMRALGLQQVDFEPLAVDSEQRRWQQKQALAAKTFLEKLADADDEVRQDFISHLSADGPTVPDRCGEKTVAAKATNPTKTNNGIYHNKDSLESAKQQAGELLLQHQHGFCPAAAQPGASAADKERTELHGLLQKLILSCDKIPTCISDAILQGRWLATGTRQQQIKFNQHRIAGLSYLNTLPEQHISVCKALPNQDGAIAFESNSTGGAALSFPCEGGKLVQAFAIKADARQLFLGITTGMQFDEFLLADADGQLLFSPLMSGASRLAGDRSGYQSFIEQADMVELQVLLQEAARKERYELRQLNSVGEKAETKPETKTEHAAPNSSTLLNVELSGQRHRVFIQPYRFAIPQIKEAKSLFTTASLTPQAAVGSGDTTQPVLQIENQTVLYLVGLRRHQPIKSVAPDTPFAAAFLLVFVAAIVLGVPYIKLYFLDHDDPLPRSLLPLLMLCLPGLAAGLVLLGETVLLYQAERDRLLRVAEGTADTLQASFEQELDQALAQLKLVADLKQAKEPTVTTTDTIWSRTCYDLSGNRSDGDQNCPQIRLEPLANANGQASATDTDNHPRQLAHQLPWLGSVTQADGKGTVKQRWFFREPVANRHGSSLTSREYYRHLRDGKATEAGGVLLRHDKTGQLFDIQRVINFTDGRNTTQLSIRRQADDFDQGMLTGEMLDLTFLAPVLPAGFRYSVIDNGTGLVLFDSSSRRELTENFYDEIADGNVLRGLVNSNARDNFASDYHNRPALLHAQPLRYGIPWTLLVHYDRTVEQQRLMVALRLAALAFLIYGLVLLITIYWLPRLFSGRDLWRWPIGQHRLRFTWAWPQWRLRHAYLDYLLALSLQLLFCLVALFTVEMRGWQALLFCFGQAALVLGSGVLLLQCLHHRLPVPMDVVQRPLVTGAMLATTWLLMLIAVEWRFWAIAIALVQLLWLGLVYLHENPQMRRRQPNSINGSNKRRFISNVAQRWVQSVLTLARRALVLQRRCWWRDSRLSQSKYERRYLTCVLAAILLIAVAPAHLFMKKSLQVQQQSKLHDDLLKLADQLDQRNRALVTKTRLLEPTCSEQEDYLLSMPAPYDFGISGTATLSVQPAQPMTAVGIGCGQLSAKNHAHHHLHYVDGTDNPAEAAEMLLIRAERYGQWTANELPPVSDRSHRSDWFQLLASLLPLDSWLGVAAGLTPDNRDLGNGWRLIGKEASSSATNDDATGAALTPCSDASPTHDCLSLAMPSQRHRYQQSIADPGRAIGALIFLTAVCAVIWLLARLIAVQYTGLHRPRARYLSPQLLPRRPQHYLLMQPTLTQQSWRHYAELRGYFCCTMADTLPVAGTVLLIGIEAELRNGEQQAALLSKLETLLCADHPDRRICLISDCQPLNRLFLPEQFPNLNEERPLSAYERAQCARILACCEPIDRIEELPAEPLAGDVSMLLDEHRNSLVGRLIQRECALFKPELQWVEAALMLQHQKSVLTEDAVFRFVGRKAAFIYRHKWEQCSIPERLALYHLANGCDLNPATRGVGESLLSRGYIRAEPALQIGNRSFAEFVVNSETPYQFEQWEELRPRGLWHSIRVPILLLLVLLLGWIAWTAGSTFSTITVILGGVLGLLTQMMNGLSMLRSQFGGQATGK